MRVRNPESRKKGCAVLKAYLEARLAGNYTRTGIHGIHERRAVQRGGVEKLQGAALKIVT